LIGRNGSYVVIAGIFDYLDFDAVLEFARRLSKELNTEVLYMGYDHENETIRHQRFERGIPQSKVPEDKLF
jgi:hypothetical protein